MVRLFGVLMTAAAIVPTNFSPAAGYATSAVSARRPSRRRTCAPQPSFRGARGNGSRLQRTVLAHRQRNANSRERHELHSLGSAEPSTAPSKPSSPDARAIPYIGRVLMAEAALAVLGHAS